jgi:hypothetical protein
MAFNMNGPPRGANVTNDQSSYDIIYKDMIFNSNLATLFNNVYSFTLQTDNINKIYSAELTSAIVVFDGSGIPVNVKNQCLILNIPQLNGNVTRIASNVQNGNNSQGTLGVQGNIFCQLPDNNTPLLIGNNPSTNTISMFIQYHKYESKQYYNPPISNLNRIDISLADPLGNILASNKITSFYFTIRLHYFQKRNSTTAFSTPVINYYSGVTDSAFGGPSQQ